MFTPQQIDQISFGKATFGGYDMQDVDEFLEPLTEDYVTLYKENALLKSKMRVLVGKLEEYRKNEASMKDAMVNAATRLGSSYFWHFPHAPLPLRRSWYEEFYAAHPEWLTENIRHRFRHAEQYSFGSLYLIEAARRGELQVAPSKGTTLFLKPSARKHEGYMERKLREADRNPQLLFGCINSLSEAPAEEQRLFHRWMCRRVGVEFPLRGEQGR